MVFISIESGDSVLIVRLFFTVFGVATGVVVVVSVLSFLVLIVVILPFEWDDRSIGVMLLAYCVDICGVKRAYAWLCIGDSV